jgi:hypothetical protein
VKSVTKSYNKSFHLVKVWCNGKKFGILSSRLKVVKGSILHACILYSCLGLEKPPRLEEAQKGLLRFKEAQKALGFGKPKLGSKKFEEAYLGSIKLT